MSLDERLIGALHLSSGVAGEGGGGADGRAFQASTVTAMLDGAYEGDVTFEQLARQGDFGIGTLNGCDGEMIALDGEFLRADETGAVHPVPPEAKTPFAVLTRFDPCEQFEIAAARDGSACGAGLDFDGVCAVLDERLGADPIIHAIRIDGLFADVHCRSVPKQERPYRPLAEVLAQQRTFDFADQRGTMLGFRFPNLGLGIGVPGYHLHFITADRQRGGHVLDCRAAEGLLSVAVDDLTDLHVETPPGVEVGGERLEQAMVDALERERGKA